MLFLGAVGPDHEEKAFWLSARNSESDLGFRPRSIGRSGEIAFSGRCSYDQTSFVEKAGWATMPGSTSPGSGVAKACAGLIANLK